LLYEENAWTIAGTVPAACKFHAAFQFGNFFANTQERKSVMLTRNIFVCTILLGLAVVTGTAEGVYYSTDNLMPSPIMTSSPADTIVAYGLTSTVRARNFNITCVGQREHPIGNDTISSSFDISMELSLDNMATWSPVNFQNTLVPMQFSEVEASTPDLFNTEILNFNASGSGVMLRESPTVHSTGSTAIRSSGTGYQIDSFFNISTDLSLNNGQTWVPATAISIDGGQNWLFNPSLRLEGVPEPGAFVILATGCIGWMVWWWRRRLS
jgi:hypothetical protein